MVQEAPEHPVQRNIVERFRVRFAPGVIRDVAAPDISVGSGKPNLLRHTCISLEPGFSPNCGPKWLPMLVDRQGVQVDLGDRGKIDVVKRICVPVHPIEK